MRELIKKWFKPEPTIKDIISDAMIRQKEIEDSYSDVTITIVGNERFIVSGDKTDECLMALRTFTNPNDCFTLRTTDGKTHVRKLIEFKQATYYPSKIQYAQNQESNSKKEYQAFKEVVKELIRSKRSIFLDLDVSMESKKECCFRCGYSTTILNTNE